MTTQRKQRTRKPFHDVLILRLKKITEDSRKPRVRLVELAALIEEADCPKERHAVRVELAKALHRMGGLDSRAWTKADRGFIKAAFDSLDDQDRKESEKRAAHEQSAVTVSAARGNGHDHAPPAKFDPAADSHVGVHS